MGVAVVTGAARGIGAAIATALFEAGHQLVLVDRCADDARLDYSLATSDELGAVAKACGDAPTVVGDIATQQVNNDAVKTAVSVYGGLDIAVSAAGVIAGAVPLWDVTDEQWAALVDTNLTGPFALARAALPVMLERPAPRHGRYVALSSAIALKATPRLAAYAASKAAVLSLVRSMAADLAGTGITANVVQPGSTMTALLDRSAAIYDLDGTASFAEHHLTGELLSAEQVASAVAWLCSGETDAVTGIALPVDGGFTAQ